MKLHAPLLLSLCLSLTVWPALADAPVTPATTAASQPNQVPDWLLQIEKQKNIKTNAMLQLALDHEADFANWPVDVQAKYLSELSMIYESLSRHREQLSAAERGLALTQDAKNATRVELLFSMGFALETQQEFAQANEYYKKGMALAEQINDEKLMIQGLLNLAAMRTEAVEDQEALGLLKDAYQRATKLGDKEMLAQVNAQLGLTYISLSDDGEGQKLLETSYKLFDELGWAKYKISTWYNLAITLSFQGKPEQALDLFDKMLKAALLEEDPVDMYFAYVGLATSSRKLKRLDAAVSYMEKAEAYLSHIEPVYYKADHHFEKALIYKALEQTNMALQEVNVAEEVLGTQKNMSEKFYALNFQRLKAQLYADAGDYEKAYKTFDEFFSNYAQLQDDKRDMQVQKMRLGFDAERQEAQNELLKKDLELKALRLQDAEHNKKMQWIWTGLFACTSMIFFGLLVRQWRRSKAVSNTGSV